MSGVVFDLLLSDQVEVEIDKDAGDGETQLAFDMYYDAASSREFRFNFSTNVQPNSASVYILRLPNGALIEETDTKTNEKPPGRGWVFHKKYDDSFSWRRWHDAAAHGDPVNWGDDAWHRLHSNLLGCSG